jgi:hypothetical protein
VHLLVPRSSVPYVCIASVAAFRADWQGDLPMRTHISLPFLSCRAKFLVSFSFSDMVMPRVNKGWIPTKMYS